MRVHPQLKVVPRSVLFVLLGFLFSVSKSLNLTFPLFCRLLAPLTFSLIAFSEPYSANVDGSRRRGSGPEGGSGSRTPSSDLRVITFRKFVCQTVIENVHVSEVTRAEINGTQTQTRGRVEVGVFTAAL